jgi:hypothetical protein
MQTISFLLKTFNQISTKTFNRLCYSSGQSVGFKMSSEAIDAAAVATPTLSKRALKRQKNQLSKEEKKIRTKERRILVQETRELGLPESDLAVTDYYFENGLRKVKVIDSSY